MVAVLIICLHLESQLAIYKAGLEAGTDTDIHKENSHSLCLFVPLGVFIGARDSQKHCC